MEPTEEEERTRYIFGAEMDSTVVVEELGLAIFQERDVVEEVEVEKKSCPFEIISRTSMGNIWFSRISDIPLRVASNVGTDN